MGKENRTGTKVEAKELSFFSNPFDPERVLSEATLGLKNEGEVIIYKEKITDNLNFVVYRSEVGFAFLLLTKDEERRAMFIFKLKGDKLSLEHRVVNPELKEQGINGSMILKKAEEYVRVLLTVKEIKDIREFEIEAGQTEVIDWALKNGYKFRDSRKESLYQKLKSSPKEVPIATEEGTVRITDDFKQGNLYGGYVILEEMYDEATAHVKERREQGKEPDLRPDSVRFELAKEI